MIVKTESNAGRDYNVQILRFGVQVKLGLVRGKEFYVSLTKAEAKRVA